MSSIRPLNDRLNDRLIVQRSEPETEPASGIVIADSAGEKPEQGVLDPTKVTRTALRTPHRWPA